MTTLPFGLKKFRVFEPQSNWYQDFTCKNQEQARVKAWVQVWKPIMEANGFLHFKDATGLEVREL